MTDRSTSNRYRRRPASRWAAHFAVLALALFQAPAWAQEGYVGARDLARAHGLEYRDIGEAAVHACKLVGPGREVILFAGLRNIIVNGRSAFLSRPARWDGTDILAPQEITDILARRLGAPANAPVRVRRLSRPKRGPYTVVLDPGHGGKDPGAVGRGGLQEKRVNLDIALRLARLLEAQGVKVVLTRRTDVFVPLDERVRIANRYRPDLFLSIHANAEVSRQQHGAMSLYPDDGPRDGRPGLHGRARDAVGTRFARPETFGAGGPVSRTALFAVLSASLETYRVRSISAARLIQEELAPVTGCVPRANGVIEDFRGLRVLRGTLAPAVLVEVDFISNRNSERKLARPSYRQAIAEAIARAVRSFLEQAPD